MNVLQLAKLTKTKSTVSETIVKFSYILFFCSSEILRSTQLTMMMTTTMMVASRHFIKRRPTTEIKEQFSFIFSFCSSFVFYVIFFFFRSRISFRIFHFVLQLQRCCAVFGVCAFYCHSFDVRKLFHRW